MTAGDGIEVWVGGHPSPKGSWNAVTVKTRQGPRARLVPNNKRSEPWSMLVHFTAKRRWSGPPIPIDVPVGVDIRFFFVRPKGHFRIRGGKPDRSPQGLKPGAPRRPMSRGHHGDGDKLERNVWDALISVAFEDDVQIVDHHATKEWGEQEGALIRIWKL